MSQYSFRDEGDQNKNSMLDLLVGKCIGSGASRRVYALLHDKSLVMKVEYKGQTFHNQTEWLIWQEMKGWPISDWFAPCIDIDGYGNVLIQKRTQPFECDKDFTQAITRTRGGVLPKCFADVHYGNFGLYDGRVTCHDYGYHTFFEQIARDMSVESGYIKFDDDEHPTPTTYDFTDGGQLVLL